MSQVPTPQTNPSHIRYIQETGLGELAGKMGIEFIEFSAEKIVATMPVETNRQPFGLLHGGAHCVLIETLGSIAAYLAAPAGKIPVGIDINATHLRAARTGTVTATSQPFHIGRSLMVHQVTITDESGRTLSTGRISNTILDAPENASQNTKAHQTATQG